MASKKRRLANGEIDSLLLVTDYSSSDFDSDFDLDDHEDITESDEEYEAVENESRRSTSPADCKREATEFIWSDSSTSRFKLPFSGKPGLQVSLVDKEDPLEYFRMFITDQMLNDIAKKTNRHAKWLRQNPALKPGSRLHDWINVTNDELLVLFGFILYQNVIHKAEVSMYWSKNLLIETPYVQKIMSEKRYSLLLRCLRFADNAAIPKHASRNENCLLKIKPFYDALVQQFSTVYIPQQNVTIDELLMLWTGPLSKMKYIPIKKARSGVKAYQLYESGSGYIWKSLIYTGNATHLATSTDNITSSRIVMTLAEKLLGKGYTIFLDDWYTSPDLFRQLRSYQTDAVGTVQLSSKNMPEQLKKKIKCGEIVSSFSHDMMALKWMDGRDVTMLSTYHTNDLFTVSRRSGQKEIPNVVLTYNLNMGAADQFDQMFCANPVEQKSSKAWYKKLFRHLLNQAAFNSYILYKKQNPKTNKDYLKFRIRLIERLLEMHANSSNVPQKGRPLSNEMNPLRLTGRHFPSLIPGNEIKSAPSRRCRVCCSHVDKDGKKIRRESRYYCADCNAPLCVSPCFQEYHTKILY